MTAMIDEVPYIRIVVCGDSAVGKSVISSRIASSQLVTQDDRDITRALDALVGETEERSSGKYSYEPTIGCQVHVLTYSCAAAPLFFVELIDVGGTSMSETSAAAQSRAVFFDSCDAVLFVWDVSDESTYHTLHRWLEEISAQNDVERRSSSPIATMNAPVSPFSPFPLYSPPGKTYHQYQYQHQHHILRTPPGGADVKRPPAAYDARYSRQRPVLLVGNKTDKLSAVQLRELEAACSEHLLISAVATDYRCLKQIEAFFIEVFEEMQARGAIHRTSSSRDQYIVPSGATAGRNEQSEFV